MRLFQCQACNNIVYFENSACERCQHRLGYAPESGVVCALEPSGEAWTALGHPRVSRNFCANAKHDACNWLTAPDSPDHFCVACRHNEIIPDLAEPGHLEAWQRLELAKHRLFYSLLRWDLPLRTKIENPQYGLVFDFLAESPAGGRLKVMTSLRALKGDRLTNIPVRTKDAPMLQPSLDRASERVPMGCERAFSSMSAAQFSTLFGRCVV
jgi:hypothetical protein